MVSKLKLFISVELFYVLFLFSGAFKESLNIPIDITAIFLALTSLAVLWMFIKNPEFKRGQLAPIILMIILLFIVLLNLLINGVTGESLDKFIKFITLTLPAFIFPLFFVKDKESVRKFMISLSILSIILSLYSLPIILGGVGMFVGFNEGNYLGLARIAGIGFIAISYFFLTSGKGNKLVVLPLLLLVSFTLISTGSRMPILAIGLISLYALFKSFVFTRNDILIKKRSLIGMSMVGVIILMIPFLYSRGYFETVFYRFQVLFTGGGGASASSRIDRIEASVQMFNESMIFGGGFGHFGDYYPGTRGVYSHNMFFEFLSELGAIGLGWFIVSLIFVVYRSVYAYKKTSKYLGAMQITAIVGFLFFFLNAMVSGDINDNRAMFGFASILLISPYLNNSSDDKPEKYAD